MRPVLILTMIYSSVLLAPVQADNDRAFLAHFSNIKSFGSTIPGNGDVNPYGVAIVPRSTGAQTGPAPASIGVVGLPEVGRASPLLTAPQKPASPGPSCRRHEGG